jgi:hypothetical protein
MGLCAWGPPRAIPGAEPDGRFPPERLPSCGPLREAQGQGTAALGRRAVRPGACAQGTPGLGMPGLRHPALLTPSPTGRGRGRQPQGMPALSGVLATREGAPCRHGSARHGARDTAAGLEGRDARSEAPGVPPRKTPAGATSVAL